MSSLNYNKLKQGTIYIANHNYQPKIDMKMLVIFFRVGLRRNLLLQILHLPILVLILITISEKSPTANRNKAENILTFRQ